MNTGRQILDALGNLPIEVDASLAPGQWQLFELAMVCPLIRKTHNFKEAAFAAGIGVL